MKNEVLAVVISLVALLAFAGGFGVSTVLQNGNKATNATTSSEIKTLCTIPDEGDLNLKILNSSNGEPLRSVPVQVRNLYPSCPPNPYTTSNLGTMYTDVNGTVATGGLGEFYLTVNYLGSYEVDIPVKLGATACVTLGIPSGEVHIWYDNLSLPHCW